MKWDTIRPERTLDMRRIALVFMVCLSASAVWGDAVRFAVIGDTQGSGEEYYLNRGVVERMVDEVLAIDPPVEFVVIVGDLVWGTNDEAVLLSQWLDWREVVDPWYQSDMTGVKVYPVPGNHDMRGTEAIALWQSTFAELPDNGPSGFEKLYWSFDAGPVHLVGISNETPGARHVVDLDWLEADLADSDAPIKLVFGHDPAFPFFLHIGSSMDKYPEERDAFWELLSEYGVSAYFCGHEHAADHWYGDGVHQIITGGAASITAFRHFLVIDADEEDVTVNVYEYDGDFREAYALSDTTWVDQGDRSKPGRSFLDAIPCVSIFACVLMCGLFGFTTLAGRGTE